MRISLWILCVCCWCRSIIRRASESDSWAWLRMTAWRASSLFPTSASNTLCCSWQQTGSGRGLLPSSPPQRPTHSAAPDNRQGVGEGLFPLPHFSVQHTLLLLTTDREWERASSLFPTSAVNTLCYSWQQTGSGRGTLPSSLFPTSESITLCCSWPSSTPTLSSTIDPALPRNRILTAAMSANCFISRSSRSSLSWLRFSCWLRSNWP